ncbi:hypothetical protein Zmor_004998 [Zophobas morio]|uniref:Ig-like domain-containing protein n=1 Tax=Zophobas morio TaxID=2755281 RepID=A0AA38ISC1_9CUCU|nr:hypothetical protein Zmor_004998 [Zophobas morio]
MEEQIRQIEENFNKNEIRNFYQDVKKEKRGYQPRVIYSKDKDGNLIGDEQARIKQWAEYFEELLNEQDTQQDTNERMNDSDDPDETTEIDEGEIRETLRQMKNNKSPGRNGIKGEMLSTRSRRSGIHRTSTIYEKRHQNIAFADDVTCITRTEAEMKKMTKNLIREAKRMGLAINQDKTKFMRIETKQTPAKPLKVTTEEGTTYKFEEVNRFKYLGVVITNKNEMNEEIEERIAKANKSVGRLNRFLRMSPTDIVLTGVQGHVTQGTIVSLLCEVKGARPIAEVEWRNTTEVPLKTDLSTGVEIKTTYEEQTDGTFTTKSKLSFSATRFENGARFECNAKNEVTETKMEPPLHTVLYLYVRYPPVITISAIEDTVVNERDNITLFCQYFSNPQKLEGATWVKDGRNVTKIPGKHKNGDTRNPSLTIVGITREDMGEYSCLLQNEVNSTLSEDFIFLDVHYPPDVEIIMVPSTPANATEQKNVTLLCNVTSGNPPALRKVRWFLDGELMAELPECNYSQAVINDTLGGPFCGIDPSILSLIKVEQSFAGNYTCQGENEAGVGPVSEPRELIVYYPPSAATLTHHPPTVIKKGQVILTCSVDEPGFPTDLTYLWFRNGHMVHNITVPNWTIPQASLETRSNFSCIALNKGGQSRPAFDFVNVEAPPALIPQDNTPYKGVLYSSQNMTLTCRIECSPVCSIKWYKDHEEIDFDRDPLYYVVNTTHPADYKKNDFESIESILVWNMKNWPDNQLDKRANNSFYTCASFDPPDRHRVGVNFTTEIAVHYPPENLTVSHTTVNVVEDETPIDVKCTGDGRPTLNYVWKKNLTGEPIMKSDTLKLPKMSRNSAGYYYCEGFNKYGNKTVGVLFNVWYKPECKIERGEVDSSQALICKADGNPNEMTFYWTIVDQNKTLDLNPSGGKTDYSYVYLDSSRTTDIEYQCVANNTIKASDPCSIKIAGSKLPWYLSKENLTVIIASIITLIICFLVVCVVIIILCRKKRQNTKCNNPLEMEEREKPDGQSPDSATQSKWPLKPGVLVHINKMHNVNISQLSVDSTPFRTTSVSSTLSKYKRNKSKVYARLQRLKDLLGFSGRDRVPSGIIEGASGVVTYKKIKPTTPSADSNTNSRKRKKPGCAPNPSSAGDKTRLGAAPPVGGSADPANDHDKGFYENLPFHGMQNPPNKPISVIAPFTQETTRNFTPAAKPLSPFSPCHKAIQRHQSFHGFQSNQQMHQLTAFPGFSFNRSNPYLNKWNFGNLQRQTPYAQSQQVTQPFRFQSNFQPILNFNPFLLPNPFSIPPRVAGRRETDVRRTASGINISVIEKPRDETRENKNKAQVSNTDPHNDKRFGSLELKKHKCYSPTFYSMRCKKHAKKRPVVYALPKKVFGDLKPPEEKPQYQDLTDSIQIFEQSPEPSETKSLPVPAPRCRKHRKKDIIYQNVSQEIQNSNSSPNPDVSNSSNDGSENLESEISVIEAQVHSSNDSKAEPKSADSKIPPRLVGVSPKVNPSADSSGIIKVEAMKALKSSPMLKVSPNFVKPKTESPKGALSLQIQAKRKNSTDNLIQIDDSSKENLPLIPQMPLLSPQSDKWSPNVASINQQNAFYTLTTPHYKHINVGLPPQYSATIPHQKHTKLIPRALFNEPLPKSKSFTSKPKHKKHFQIPLQKCHSFKFQTAESYFQPIRNVHEEDLMKNGYVSDYPDGRSRHHKRDKPKQKTKGPLVVMRPSDYHGGLNFPESVQSSVQLQYPQPVLGRSSKKPNGVVYADLDMPKTNKKGSHESSSSSQSKTQKSKPKTEYATLSFNDVGQEIDV